MVKEPDAADAAAPEPEPEAAEEPEPEIMEVWDEPDESEGGATTETEIAHPEDGEAEHGKEPEESGALAEVLEWNATIHVFPREFGRKGLPLKYLGFVPEVIWQAWVIILWLHGTIKGWLGPLKWSIDKVEEIAKPYIERAYQSVNAYVNPKAILVKADSKVDGVVKFLDRILPESVSRAFSRAYNICIKVVARIWNEGLKPSATSYYNKYLPVLEAYAVSAYKASIRVPLVPPFFAVARYLVVNTNKAIAVVKNSGLPFTGYLPLLPVDYCDRLTKSD